MALTWAAKVLKKDFPLSPCRSPLPVLRADEVESSIAALPEALEDESEEAEELNVRASKAMWRGLKLLHSSLRASNVLASVAPDLAPWLRFRTTHASALEPDSSIP